MLLRVALAIYLFLGFFTIVWGAWYALQPGILGYHALAMGGTEATLPPGVVALYFAYRLSLGAFGAAIGVLMTALALGPMRHGARWAALAASGAYCLAAGSIGFAAFRVETQTGAQTGWQVLPLAVLLVLLACALYLGAGPEKGER